MDRRHVTGSAQIIRADSRQLPLDDDSVDLVVTSPPYFALRSYQDGGEHYAGQIGDEPTPAEFIDALLEVTAECVRVLKPSGSLWVNLGDKYVADNRGSGIDDKRRDGRKFAPRGRAGFPTGGMRQKSLMGIPWRYAIRCIDELGLILRAEVIWSKPNGLPESVTDRVRRSHETWFHFTLAPRYYSAVDEIREAHAGEFLSSGVKNPRYGRPGGLMPQEARGEHSAGAVERVRAHGRDPETRGVNHPTSLNPLGKLPGSVWEIPTEPLIVPKHLGVDHFAAFPTEWPRRIIQGWSPAGVCTECGEGRRPVSDTAEMRPRASLQMQQRERTASSGGVGRVGLGIPAAERERTITGYACACPEPTARTRPGVVLDPFGGTGTTALVAKALGRHGISVDMSADYCRLAEWRTNDPAQLAKAARREYKPSRQIDGHADLLELLGEEVS